MPPKSIVWRFFERVSGTTSKCQLCHKSLKSCGNTTNLVGHLKYKHKEVYVKHFQENKTVDETVPLLDPDNPNSDPVAVTEPVASSSTSSIHSATSASSKPRQRSLPEVISAAAAYQEGGEKKEKLSDAILFMICRDDQPISIVEDEGFRYLIKVSAPLYTIPSRRTIDSMLDQKYDLISTLVKQDLSTVDYFCLTTDIWTEGYQTKSFLGVTAHFVIERDSQLQTESIIIGIKELVESHTGQYIADILRNICSDWGLKEEKVLLVVTDGASNMGKGVEIAFGKKKHSHCFAHMLNLLAQKTIESEEIPELKVILDKVKGIVKWFKQSVVGSDELRRKTKDLDKKILIQSVPTRWNSTYYMIERFLYLREQVSCIIAFNSSAPKMLEADEVEFLLELLLLLRPIESATKDLSGEKYVTSSVVIPMVKLLKKNIDKVTITSALGEKVKRTLLVQWDKRFSKIEQLHFFPIATILDPRFKTLHFEDKTALAATLKKISTELKKEEESSESDRDHSSPPSAGTNETDTGHFSLWDDHDKLVQDSWKLKKKAKVMEGVDSFAPLHPELALYLKSPLSSRNPSQSNPLQIWNESQHHYSTLFTLAKKYLTVLATSVPSERLFSAAGGIVSSKRSRLSGDKVDKLLFLRSVNKKYWGINI